MSSLPFPAPLDAAARAATWTAAWALLDRPAPAWLLAELEQACGEPPRHYPDRRHLGECLVLWTRWRTHCERPVEVAVTLWFHDAVYATRHGAPTGGVFLGGNVAVAADADALLDIDLAILGSRAERFERYDRDVRLEYADVPLGTYTRRRREVLQGLAARAPLYRGAAAVELLEAQAHVNLAAALARLQQ